jgi:hypothetical protein
MAMNLEPKCSRQTRINGVPGSGGGQELHGSQFELTARRLWPYILESDQARMLVKSLHAWSEKVGSEQAIQWVIQTLRQEQPASLEALILRLQQLSGELIPEGRQ